MWCWAAFFSNEGFGQQTCTSSTCRIAKLNLGYGWLVLVSRSVLKTQWKQRRHFQITERFTLVRALNKTCLRSMVYELRSDHKSFAIVSFYTDLCNSNTHTLDVFSECVCVKLNSVTLGKVASQSKIINVWNIYSLIFEQVHSSDFCMVVMHNKVLTQYHSFPLPMNSLSLSLPFFPFQNGTLQLAWFGSAHLLSVINALLTALNLLSIIHHTVPPS